MAFELQADCFAGVWAHDASQRRLLEEGDVEEAIRTALAVGDFNATTPGTTARRGSAPGPGTRASAPATRPGARWRATAEPAAGDRHVGNRPVTYSGSPTPAGAASASRRSTRRSAAWTGEPFSA